MFGFSCQPDLPTALSQPADISSPVSASFVHQSSRQCCFMMCCKTTLRVLSVAASFITAQPSRRDIIHHCLLRAWSQSWIRAAASAQSRVNAPQKVPLSSGCVFFLPFFLIFFQEMGLLLTFCSQPRVQNRKPNFKIQLTVPNGGDFNL